MKLQLFFVFQFLFLSSITSQNLSIYHSFEDGIKMANKAKKPICLVFTGTTCEQLKKVDAQLSDNTSINRILEKEYILIVLFVDDDEKLAEPFDQYFYNKRKYTVRTQGDKWLRLEREMFKSDSQPLISIIKSKDIIVSKSIGFTTDEELENYLLDGVNRYESL